MEVISVSDMVAGIVVPPEDGYEFHDCRDCKYLYYPMYNGPCKDCVNNSSILGKTKPVNRWEKMDDV